MKILGYLWPMITGASGIYLAVKYIMSVQKDGLNEKNRKILLLVVILSISLSLACFGFLIDGLPSVKDGVLTFIATFLVVVDVYFLYRVISIFTWNSFVSVFVRFVKTIDSVLYLAVFWNVYFVFFDEKKIFLSLIFLFFSYSVVVMVFLRIISGRKMFVGGVKVTRTLRGVLQDFLRMLVLVFLSIEAYAKIYISTGISSSGKSIGDLPNAMYFSVITWTTVGYGDILPEGYSRLVSATEAVTGVITMGLLIAALTTIAQIDLKSIPE